MPEAKLRATPPTIAMPRHHPRTNIGPFTLARGLTRTRTTAMTGSGLIAIPSALGSISPIASPTTGPPSWSYPSGRRAPGWPLLDPTAYGAAAYRQPALSSRKDSQQPGQSAGEGEFWALRSRDDIHRLRQCEGRM